MHKGDPLFCGYRGGRVVGTREAVLGCIIDDDSSMGICAELKPRFDLVDYRPAGFEWWDGGDGSLQLSLAILADYLGDDEAALRLYRDFTWKVIAALPCHEGWSLRPKQIDEGIAGVEVFLALHGP